MKIEIVNFIFQNINRCKKALIDDNRSRAFDAFIFRIGVKFGVPDYVQQKSFFLTLTMPF